MYGHIIHCHCSFFFQIVTFPIHVMTVFIRHLIKSTTFIASPFSYKHIFNIFFLKHYRAMPTEREQRDDKESFENAKR